jgi:hypothetical protein
LRKQLAHRFNASIILEPAVKAAVGKQMVPDLQMIRPGEEVDFLAPLSGG